MSSIYRTVCRHLTKRSHAARGSYSRRDCVRRWVSLQLGRGIDSPVRRMRGCSRRLRCRDCMNTDMMIREIDVKNFRALRSVKFEEFSNINFILGRNNSGKSSVLEALFLGMYSSPRLLFTNRGLPDPERGDDFLQLFYGRDRNNTPCIDMGRYRAELDIERDKLFIRYSSENEEFGVTTISVSKGSWEEKDEMNHSFYRDFYKPAVFLPIRGGAPDFNLNGVERILDDGEENTVTQILHSIDPSIMGDGTRKVFALCTNLYNLKNGAVIVDEIENGLHYKSIRVVLNFMLYFVRKFPETQLFITTHSFDVLRSLDALMDEEPEGENLISVYSLDRYDGDESNVWRHDRASLRHTLECEIELR